MRKSQPPHNFRIIEDGKLYASGQPDKDFLLHLEERYKIKTIVNLRTEFEDFEKEFIENHGINLLHIPLFIFWQTPKEKNVLDFLKLFNNLKKCPVLIHCRRGRDRTGIMVGFFRLLYQDWPVKNVLWEMKKNKVHFYWRLFMRWKWKKFQKIYEPY